MDPSNSSYYANLPAGAPPPGVISNFDHAESRAIEAYIGMGICIGVTLIFVTLRVYVKLAITHHWGWDDWACILGYTLIVAHDGVSFAVMGPGKWLGTHLWDIRFMSFTKWYLQSTLAAINLYAASAFFTKLSLFILYLRLFKPNKVTRWLIYGGMIVCGLFYSASIISNCALCMPRPGQPNELASWLASEQVCASPTIRLALVQAVFGTLSDIYLLVIPIKSVFQLQLPTSRKVGVSAVFMTGTIAIACSLGSLSYRAQLLHTHDSTWLSLPVYIFSAAEMSAGIICGCMPVLAALFRSRASREYRFPSLRYFSWRNYSRRLIISNDKLRPPNNSLHLEKPPTGSEQELSGSDLELESGTSVTNSNGVLRVARDF